MNVAERNWKPKDMSKEITLDRDLQWLGFISAAFGPIVYVLGVYFLGPWALLYLLPVLPLASNRLEPMPAGGQSDRWRDRHPVIRWYLWHIRNPWEDLKKYYLGFGYAKQVKEEQVTKNFRVYWWGWVPFPYYKKKTHGWQVMVGWKSRGALSITLRR